MDLVVALLTMSGFDLNELADVFDSAGKRATLYTVTAPNGETFLLTLAGIVPGHANIKDDPRPHPGVPASLYMRDKLN